MAFPYSAGDVLTAANLNSTFGLVHIETFTGTGVSAANFDDVFKRDFDAFSVVVRLRAMPNNLSMRLRVGGVTSTSANYNWVIHGVSSNGTALTQNASATTTFVLQTTNISSTVSRQGCVFDILYPNAADMTTYMGNAQSYNSGGNYWTYNIGGTNVSASAYDGFTIFPSSGTINHTTSIYGYNNG